MPRQARIDAPGALHHIIARGIERRDIFRDDLDRNSFLTRLEKIVNETHTECYAWALMPNHFHLLFKTGKVPISTVMRRLLTGYAIGFNIRHRRSGHLFQNRYKSILCQEDPYLKELVRYIHLNPLRAGIVENLKALGRYRYSGHGAVINKQKISWHRTGAVLALFSDRIAEARRLYLQFVKAGIDQGSRPELTGGGLIRSSGGWAVVKSLRKAGIWFKSDERILGDSEFVDTVLSDAQEALDSHYVLASKGVNIDQLIKRAAQHFSLSPEKLMGPGKNRDVVKARRIVCFWSVHRLGMTMTAVAKKLGVSVPTVSVAAAEGERLAREENISLLKMLNIKI
jgi:REP-associated tyrosine transposase